AVVFFFQAEDGIRDFHVTGVQTCALPICSSPNGGIGALPGRSWLRMDATPCRLGAAPRSIGSALACQVFAALWLSKQRQELAHRSEERRVGKEGRWRGSTERRR